MSRASICMSFLTTVWRLRMTEARQFLKSSFPIWRGVRPSRISKLTLLWPLPGEWQIMRSISPTSFLPSCSFPCFSSSSSLILFVLFPVFALRLLTLTFWSEFLPRNCPAVSFSLFSSPRDEGRLWRAQRGLLFSPQVCQYISTLPSHHREGRIAIQSQERGKVKQTLVFTSLFVCLYLDGHSSSGKQKGTLGKHVYSLLLVREEEGARRMLGLNMKEPLVRGEEGKEIRGCISSLPTGMLSGSQLPQGEGVSSCSTASFISSC